MGWLGACAGFLIAGAVLAPSLVGKTVFLPVDIWMQSVPFSSSAAKGASRPPHNPLLTDPAFVYPPQYRLVREAIRAGTFPLWNRYQRAGEPFLATGISGPLEPLNLPILLLPWPVGYAWSALLRFGLMWLGAYLFARALGLGRAWSTTVAVGFCFAPGFIVHFQQQPRAIAHMGLPWLLLCVERLAAAMPRGPRAMVRAAWPLAVVEYVVAVAGYAPAAFNVSFGALLYLMLVLPWRPRTAAVRARIIGLGALGLGCAMAAPGLMPFLEALLPSDTFAGRSQGAGLWALPGEALRLFWDPYALGSPIAGAPRPWRGSINFEEEQQYVGLLPFVFLLGGALPSRGRSRPEERRRLAVLAGIALFAAAMAYGLPPLHAWVTQLAPFSFNANPRLLILTQVAIPVLAALSARRWLEPRPAARPRPVLVWALTGAACAGAIALVALALTQSWNVRPWLALGSGLSLFVAGRFATTGAQRRLVSAVVPVLLLADLAPVYHGYHPQPPRDWADPARAISNLPPALKGELDSRVAFELFTPQNLPAILGMEDIRGYSFPVPLRYEAYMGHALGVMDTETTFYRADLERVRVVRGIERTCARWLMTTAEYGAQAPELTKVWELDGTKLYRLSRASPCWAWYPSAEVATAIDIGDAVARFGASLSHGLERIIVERGAGAEPSAPPSAGVIAAARWTSPHSVEVEVPAAARTHDGWLVARVTWDKGWQAESSDGAPLEVVPAQLRFIAVATPAGTERVLLRYRTPHLATWLALSTSGFVTTAAAAWWSRRVPRSGTGTGG